jgi:hypothetical protein
MELKNEFEVLLETIQQQAELEGDYLTGITALIPHAAYHAGTIHQLIERVHTVGGNNPTLIKPKNHTGDKHGSTISTYTDN